MSGHVGQDRCSSVSTFVTCLRNASLQKPSGRAENGLRAPWVVALCEEGVGGEQALLACLHPAVPGISAPGLCSPSHPRHFYSSDDLPAEGFPLGFLGQAHPLCPALGPPPCILRVLLYLRRGLCRTVGKATGRGYSVPPRRAGDLGYLRW